jgi:hypothetical protein
MTPYNPNLPGVPDLRGGCFIYLTPLPGLQKISTRVLGEGRLPAGRPSTHLTNPEDPEDSVSLFPVFSLNSSGRRRGGDIQVMQSAEKEKSGIEKAGEKLFNFAVDREDVKTLMALLPAQAHIERGKVEYELQLLKIISVGWSISYFLQGRSRKNELAEVYWKAIHGLSEGIYSATGFMIGQNIDYFQELRNRLDTYVQALGEKPGAAEPAAVIGPEFARACGNVADVYTVLTGCRMFIGTIGRVKAYLDALDLE